MNFLGALLAQFAAPLVEAIKVTIVLGAAWMASSLLSRQSAAQRHRVWGAGIVAALLLPALAFIMPVHYSGRVGLATARLVMQVSAPAGAVASSAPAATAGQIRAYQSRGLETTLAVVWLAGFALLALRLLAGLRRLGKISAGSGPLNETAWTHLAAELSQSLGVHRRVLILVSRNPAFIPMTWGVVRPRIVLPSDAVRWPQQRRRIVLAHELAHIGRKDWLLQICAELMCCVYWFHPLAWIAARRLRQESEQACDDAVLSIDVPAAEYAGELLELVQTLGASGRRQAAALAIVRFSELERRFEAMMATTIDRSRLSKKAGLLVAGVVVLLLLPLAVFRLPAQPQANSAPHGWFLAGSAPANYTTGVDREADHQGHPSAYLKARPEADKGFGTLMQSFSAGQYLGQRVRLSANLKSEDVSDWAGLWMRVDQGSSVVAFDNMEHRAIKGTTGWQEYSVVLDVPKDATGISMGALLTKGGEIWLSNVKFETVGTDVPTTGNPMPRVAPGPANLSFDN